MAIHPATDDLITFLDSLAKLDPVGMGKLIAARVPCNLDVLGHPTVQAGIWGDLKSAPGAYDANFDDKQPVVGFLGVINGFCGTFDKGPFEGWGPIAAVIEDDGSCSGFRRTDATT